MKALRYCYLIAAVIGWVFVIPAWFYLGCPL